MEKLANKETFKHYLLFWSGQLFSLFGSNIVFFSIAIWITYLTLSPIFVSLAMFLFILPQVIIMPFAGVLSDKLNRKTIIIVVDSLQALATFLLITLFLLNTASLWIVLAFISLRSIFQAFHLPTVNAIIPVMVPKDKLSKINAINFLFTGVVQMFAPMVAALLMGFLVIEVILWVDIITFLIALIPLFLIKIPLAGESKNKEEKISFFKEFKLGIKTLKLIPGLVSIVLLSMLLNFLVTPIDAIMPYYIIAWHDGTDFDFALVAAFFQGGMICGAIFTSLKETWNHKLRVIFINIGILLVGYIVYGIAPIGWILIICIGSLIMGITLPIIMALYQTIMQTIVPPDKYGRITSIDSSFSMVFMPIATLISGPLAMILGASNLYVICALLALIVTALIWTFSRLRHIDYESEATINMISDNIKNLTL